VTRVLNCQPDVAGARGNWLKAPSFGAVRAPAELDQSGRVKRIYDQGGTSRCVGWGLGFAMMLAGKLDEQPSAKWIYDSARAVARDLGIDDGTTIGAAVEGIGRVGFVRESFLPSTESNVEDPPYWDDVQRAIDQRGLVASRLDCALADRKAAIKGALVSGFGVALGTDVNWDYVASYRGGVWPGFDGPRAGGHCQGALDYDDEALRLVGSYGEDWGEGGLTRIAWPFICSERTRDIWVVKLVPRFSR